MSHLAQLESKSLFRFVTFVIVLVILTRPVSFAEQVTTVVVNPIPNLLNDHSEQPAPYNLFLNSFSDISLVFVPATRILDQFNQAHVSCLFPGSLNTMPKKEKLIQSDPVRVTSAYLFSLSPEPSKITDTSVIALRRGYIYGGIRQKLKANYVELSTAQETLKFLKLARADAVIGYLPDIQAAAINEAIPMPFYDERKPIYRSSHRFVCHDTQHNRNFLKKANKHISDFTAQASDNVMSPE